MVITQMLLFALAGWVALLLILLSTILQESGLPTSLSMVLSIMAVFLSFLEKKLSTVIKKPEMFVWSAIMIKTFKGWFTMTVFILNGTTNDFYIGIFFLFTSCLGGFFFWLNDTKRPEELRASPTETDIAILLKSLRDRVLINQRARLDG